MKVEAEAPPIKELTYQSEPSPRDGKSKDTNVLPLYSGEKYN